VTGLVHDAEGLLLTLAGCIVLTVAAVTWMARRRLPLAIRRPPQRCAAVTPVVLPPAASKSWLCEKCWWAWPLAAPFCGVCGGSRAAAGAAREVTVRTGIASTDIDNLMTRWKDGAYE
jgi:hypothetical protein